jgi:hypothetical protein
MRFGVIVLAGIFQIFHGDRSASPRVCRREHYPSFEIGRVCAFDDASELECADRGGMSQIAVGKSEDTGTCANRCNFEFHGLTFPFDLIFAWQAVLSNRPRLHCVCWRVGSQVVNQDPHRSDEGPIPGPRGFIDNNSDWGGASPLNWRLGTRLEQGIEKLEHCQMVAPAEGAWRAASSSRAPDFFPARGAPTCRSAKQQDRKLGGDGMVLGNCPALSFIFISEKRI